MFKWPTLREQLQVRPVVAAALVASRMCFLLTNQQCRSTEWTGSSKDVFLSFKTDCKDFCLIKLHILIIVNLSFACFTETAIDHCIRL